MFGLGYSPEIKLLLSKKVKVVLLHTQVELLHTFLSKIIKKNKGFCKNPIRFEMSSKYFEMFGLGFRLHLRQPPVKKKKPNSLLLYPTLIISNKHRPTPQTH